MACVRSSVPLFRSWGSCVRCFSVHVSGPTDYISTSSSSSRTLSSLDASDAELLEAARKSRFEPPRGVTYDQAWSRMYEILERECQETGSIGFGDFLVLSNALLRYQATEASKTVINRGRIVDMVSKRLSRRHKLSNVFTLIQYLRFVSLAGVKYSNSLVEYSLEHVLLGPKQRGRPISLKTTGVLEIADILMSLVSSQIPSRDIFQIIRSCLDECTTSDPDTYSDRTNSMALKVCERMADSLKRSKPSFDDNSSESYNECLNLLMDFTRNRHCASSCILELFLSESREAMDEGESQFLHCKHLVEYIRDHQLVRWASVRGLFEVHPGLRDELKTLFEYTGLPRRKRTRFSPGLVSGNFSSSNFVYLTFPSNKSISGEYVEVESNGALSRRVYKKRDSNSYLYYSDVNQAWQIGSDLTNQMVRTAWAKSKSLGSSEDAPPASGEWHVYSKKEGKFLANSDIRESPTMIGLRADEAPNAENDENDDTTEVSVAEVQSVDPRTNLLTRWNSKESSNPCPIISPKIETKVAEMETKLAQLQELVLRMSQVDSDVKWSSEPADSQEVKSENENSAHPGLLDFESFLNAETRFAAQERMRKLVARKFR